MRWVFSLLLLVTAVSAFECDSDTIMRLATNHRAKDLEEECKRDRQTHVKCDNYEEVEKLWKEYEDLQKEYKKVVTDCVKERASLRVRRHRNYDLNDPNIDHIGHNHRRRRHGNHDPNDPNIDHTGHNHRRRRHEDHDPNDPNINHTGHNHGEKKRENMKNRRELQEIESHTDKQRKGRESTNPDEQCKTEAFKNLQQLHNGFKDYCVKGNICLPDEDLPVGSKRDTFKRLQEQRAGKYTKYLLAVATCNAS